MRCAINPPSYSVACAGYGRNRKAHIMRGILLWAVGIPIPVIILLYLFHVI
jgi:hypothetical protein